MALKSPGWGATLSLMRIAAALALVLALAGPALAETAAIATPRDKVIDALYERLAKAKTDEEAKGITGALERAQLRSGSDTADLLMTRALTAIQAGNSEVAVDILTSIVKLDPDFTEAWNKRATLYYLKNDYARSMADIAETLKRDPRHFGAWAGLGMILRETGDKKRAYAAFQHALAVNPHLDTVQKALDELKPDVEGRDI